MSDAQVSIPGYLTILFLFLVSFIFYSFRVFANPKNFPFHAYPTVSITYFCSLAVLLIAPLDVSLTVIGRRSIEAEQDSEDSRSLIRLYLSMYIPVAIFSSIVLIYQEFFNMSGYFTFASKIYYSFVEMMYYNAVSAVAGFIFFGILVGTGVVPANGSAVLLTVVLLSNTFGLAVLMILLGYGLVSFPRMLWDMGNIERELGYMQHKAASRFKGMNEASLNVSLAVSDVLKTKQELVSHADASLTEAIEVTLKDCPSDFTSSTMGKLAVDKEGKITIHSLAALRQRVFYLRDAYDMAVGRVEQTKQRAYHYEDLVEALRRTDGVKKIKWSFSPESSEWEYTWHIRVFPLLCRGGALASALLSLFSYLGVIGTMSGVGPGVSVYFLAVHDDRASGTGIVVFILFTLGYVGYVTMWSLFQMKITGFMELLPGQLTTANSLSVNARLCARLSSPLTFFYLGWIFENGVRKGSWTDAADDGEDNLTTAFSRFYKINVIPVMGDSFNTIFPIIMFSISGLVMFNLMNWILVKCKLDAYQFGSEILTDEQLREGQRQLTRHKRTMERSFQRQALKKLTSGQSSISASASSAFSSLFGAREKEPEIAAVNQSESNDVLNTDTFSEPPAFEGWADKKGNKKFGVAGGYQPRYLVVKKPGILYYYKDKGTHQNCLGQVDLRLVMSFKVEAESKKSAGQADAALVRLDLELADRTMKFRFKTNADAIMWKERLSTWKDFALDYGTFFPSSGVVDNDDGEGANDIEKQLGGGLDDDIVDTTEISASLLASSKSSTSTRSGSKATSDFTASKGGTNAYSSSLPLPSSSMSLSEKPPSLSGWLEKKQSPKLGISSWQRRFFRINEKTHALEYFKSDSATEKISGSIDLKLIVEIAVDPEAKESEGRFTIDMGDRVYRLRAPSKKDTQRWMDELNAWREHALLSF